MNLSYYTGIFLAVGTCAAFYFKLYDIILRHLGKNYIKKIKQKQAENVDKIPTIVGIVAIDTNNEEVSLDPEVINKIHNELKELNELVIGKLNLEFILHSSISSISIESVTISFLPPFIQKTPGYLGELLKNKTKLCIKENSYSIE